MTDSDLRDSRSNTERTSLADQPSDLRETLAPNLRVRPSGRLVKKRKRQIPVTIRILLPLLLLGLLGKQLFDWWTESRVVIEFVDIDGNPVEVDGEIALFTDSQHPADPSPQRLLRAPVPVTGSSFVFDAEEVGTGANVRLRSEQSGTAFVAVEADGRPTKLRVGTPVTRTGRVTDSSGRPIEGASVLAIGRHTRGVPLAESVTDAEGRFELGGVSSSQLIWIVRAVAPGYVFKEVDWDVRENGGPDDKPIVLTESRPIPGRLGLPEGLDPAGLSVGVVRLSEVDALVGAEGRFVLDHLPAQLTRVRLVVRGLPPGYTHAQTVAPLPTERVEILVEKARKVRGQVVSGHDDRGLAFARVSHLDGPRGEEFVVCDEEGRFELDYAPPHDLTLYATYVRPGDGTQASASVDLEGGVDEVFLSIPIY